MLSSVAVKLDKVLNVSHFNVHVDDALAKFAAKAIDHCTVRVLLQSPRTGSRYGRRTGLEVKVSFDSLIGNQASLNSTRKWSSLVTTLSLKGVEHWPALCYISHP